MTSKTQTTAKPAPSRRTLSTVILVLWVALLPVWLHASDAAKPNVVFILADDLGVNDLSLYGSKFFETPNIDALARRGMKFSQAYSASPLCSPTRSSILTGLYPARIGITAPVCHVPEVILEKAAMKKAGTTQKTLLAESVTRLKANYYTLSSPPTTARISSRIANTCLRSLPRYRSPAPSPCARVKERSTRPARACHWSSSGRER